MLEMLECKNVSCKFTMVIMSQNTKKLLTHFNVKKKSLFCIIIFLAVCMHT